MDDFGSWSDVLHCELTLDGPLKRIYVVRETNSTQDAARRIGAVPGDVIVAGRQTHGRGTRGRSWLDTGADGIAMTFVVPNDRSERLMLAAAVAVARAAEALLKRPVGIKWPNDIVVEGRKLAGILVEQSQAARQMHGSNAARVAATRRASSARALVGVGMNITQTHWPAELEATAVSAVQLGATVCRIEAAAALVRSFCEMLPSSDDALVSAYQQRDALRGRQTTLRSGDALVSGIIREINPLTGLHIDTGTGERCLPPQTTHLVKR